MVESMRERWGRANQPIRLTISVHIAAVVDWEFAFSSGSPFIDLGNLLRPPLGDLPGFEEAVADGYRAAGRVLPDDWRRRSL
jgi:hypothetical protein